MKPAAIRAFIQAHMPIVMERLNKSNKDGHLVYAEDVFEHFPSEAAFYKEFGVTPKDFYCFYTNSPCFEIIKRVTRGEFSTAVPRLYQIKKGKTLSEALDNLIEHGTTVIDCLQAVNIAWCLCIEALMIECYGIEQGKARFNALLNVETQPFQISGFDVNQKTGNLSRAAYCIPVPVLSYFIEDLPESSQVYPTAKDDPRLKPGTRITLYNMPEYKIKHVIGNAGAMNLICIDKDTYMGFGLGEGTFTESKVNAWLKNSYESMQPLEVRKNWLNTIALAKKEAQPTRNPYPAGYTADTAVQMNYDKLGQLTEDFQGTLTRVAVYIDEYENKQLRLFDREFGAFVWPTLTSTAATSLSDRTRMLLTNTGTGAEKTSDRDCADILFKVTQHRFKYNDEIAAYWMATESETEAARIAGQLNRPEWGLHIKYNKIKPSSKFPDHYRIDVKSFDPKTISLSNINAKLT